MFYSDKFSNKSFNFFDNSSNLNGLSKNPLQPQAKLILSGVLPNPLVWRTFTSGLIPLSLTQVVDPFSSGSYISKTTKQMSSTFSLNILVASVPFAACITL